MPSKHGTGVCHKAPVPVSFVFSKTSLKTKLSITHLPPDCTMVGGIWEGVSCKGFPVFLISAKKLGLQIPLCL